MGYSGIELRHLRHFVALAEEMHFGRAARRCNISQPPFSVSIRQLEARLGLALVERTSHEVRLTTAGAAFYKEAGKVLSQFQQAADIAVRVNDGLQGVLKIGFFASMLNRGLDLAVAHFEKEFPAVGLQLIELSTAEQIPAVQWRQIQYGFVASAVVPAVLASQELLREPFMLCLPVDHPAPPRGSRALAYFRNEPFILFSRAFSPTYFDQVVSRCVVAGFHPNIVHEMRSWSTVVSCVSKGMGITVVPRSVAKANPPGVRFIDLGPSPVESIISGVWLKSEDRNAALRAWRRVVRRTFRV